MTRRVAIEVRGSETRCTGTRDAPHPDQVIYIPAGQTVRCPVCGQAYRRSGSWNRLSGAIWPKRK